MTYIIKSFHELTLEEIYQILKIRSAIFVVEQACVYQDLDDKDQGAYHVLLKEEEEVKAYLRVLAPGVSFKEASLGRVLTVARGEGFGKDLLLAGIAVAKEKWQAQQIRIEAQSYAKGFYEKVGFKQVSEEFLEDGIPHIEMLLDVNYDKFKAEGR